MKSVLIAILMPLSLYAEIVPPASCEYQTKLGKCHGDCRCVWCVSKDPPKCLYLADVKFDIKHCSNYTRGHDCVDEISSAIILYVILGVTGGIYAIVVGGAVLLISTLWCFSLIAKCVVCSDVKNRVTKTNEGMPLVQDL